MVAGADYSMLSPQALETLRKIAVPISLGLSPDDVAATLKKPTRWVNKRVAELRAELRQLGASK